MKRVSLRTTVKSWTLPRTGYDGMDCIQGFTSSLCCLGLGVVEAGVERVLLGTLFFLGLAWTGYQHQRAMHHT
jgi:hypothetical protein